MNQNLGNFLRCLVGEKPTTWDLALPTAEFAHYNAVNKSTEVVHGVVPHLPIDLVPLPINSRPAEFAETFAKHIHDVHANVQ